MTLLDTLNTLFLTETFFSWLGLLILLAIVGGFAATKNLVLGVLAIPISVFIGLMYLNSGLGWHSLIMFIAAIGIVIYDAKDL